MSAVASPRRATSKRCPARRTGYIGAGAVAIGLAPLRRGLDPAVERRRDTRVRCGGGRPSVSADNPVRSPLVKILHEDRSVIDRIPWFAQREPALTALRIPAAASSGDTPR